MGTLYLISTPIGNLKDITIRAIETLNNTEYILCEDTRRTGLLLKTIGDNKIHKFISYYDQVESLRIPTILNILENNDIALVSDGGTPLISDPGFRLVKECIKRNIRITPIPGPSALITALIMSGQPVDNFWFLGYLPDSQNKKRKLLIKLKENSKYFVNFKDPTYIFYETPHRLSETLQLIREILGDITVTVARELTKVHEEVINENVGNLISKYQQEKIYGEITLLFHL